MTVVLSAQPAMAELVNINLRIWCLIRCLSINTIPFFKDIDSFSKKQLLHSFDDIEKQ